MSEARRYPRVARVNEVLREVIAETLERLSDSDERLDLVTVTGIKCDPDLRHAIVFYSSLSSAEVDQALDEHRAEFQKVIGREVRLKRTPHLKFVPDPVLATAHRIEEIIQGIREDD